MSLESILKPLSLKTKAISRRALLASALLVSLAAMLPGSAFAQNAWTSEELFPHFNQGWKNELAPLRDQLDPEKDYVTWIVEGTKKPFDLRSAETFRRSMLPIYNLQGSKNMDAISHMMVAWQCHDENGNLIRGATAMSGENKMQSRDLVLSGWGQSTFLAVFTDGYLHTPNDVYRVANTSKEKGLPFGHVTFEVPRENCQNMLRFLRKFIDHPRQPIALFNAGLDPLKFEGGGCGSFATALLDQAGVMKSVRPLLWRKLKGTRKLMGVGSKMPVDTIVPLPQDIIDEENNVFFNTLLVTPWTKEDGPEIKVIDPELGLVALKTIAASYTSNPKAKAKGLLTSAYEPRVIESSLAYLNQGAMMEKIEINEQNDPQAARVARQVRKELKSLKDDGMKIKSTRIGEFWGLLIEK